MRLDGLDAYQGNLDLLLAIKRTQQQHDARLPTHGKKIAAPQLCAVKTGAKHAKS